MASPRNESTLLSQVPWSIGWKATHNAPSVKPASALPVNHGCLTWWMQLLVDSETQHVTQRHPVRTGLKTRSAAAIDPVLRGSHQVRHALRPWMRHTLRPWTRHTLRPWMRHVLRRWTRHALCICTNASPDRALSKAAFTLVTRCRLFDVGVKMTKFLTSTTAHH